MSSKLMFIVSYFTIVALVFQSCASGSYWRKVDKKEVVDRNAIKRYQYRLKPFHKPNKQNPVGEFRLEQRPIYGSKVITKEQKTVQKSDPQLIAWGLLVFLGAGSSIVGLFVVDDVEPVGPVVTAALLGGLGYWSLKVGIKGKTKKTSEFRRQEEVGYREIEGAWGSSEVSGKVWLESPFLPRSVDRPVRNGIMSVDYVADLGIGLNEPIQNQPIKFRIYNNQLGINEEFRAHPSKFLQPHLEITKQVDNIRSGPGVNYNIIQKCLRGDLYAVKGKSGNWLKVELRNRTAWTHNSIGRIVYAQPYRLDKAGPPNLVAEVAFSESSGNGRLDAEETAKLTVKIQNKGKSPGYRIKITPKPLTGLSSIDIENEQTVGRINPGETKEVTFEMEAGLKVATSTERIRVEFTEYNGFQPQPLFVSFETKAFEPPDLLVVDIGIDDASGNGQIEQGEVAKITARIQNVGYGKAKQVQAQIELGANVFLAEVSKKFFDLGTLDYNEHQDISFSIYTNNLITGEIPITLSVAESRSKYGTHKKLGLVVNQRQRLASEFVFEGREEERENFRDVTGLSIDIENDIPVTRYKNASGVALILGISDYQKTGIPKVEYAKRDAYWVRQYAEKVLGFESNRIFPRNPEEVMTAGTIKTYVKYRLPDIVRDYEDDVFVYYSGHGAPNLYNKSAYLVPYDCDPNYVNDDNAYRLDEFYSDLTQLNAKTLTIVLDACFSGYARDGGHIIRQASPLFIKVENPILRAANTVLFSSSAIDQVSNWYPQMKHGMFTYFFLKGLKGEADSNFDGRITVGEMKSFLINDRHGVPYWSLSEHGRKQVPEVLGNMDRVLVNFR